MLRIPARGRHISQEPQIIAPHLLGVPLATFRRRAWAYLTDLILFGLVFGALLVGFSAWDMHRMDATFFSRLNSYGSLVDPAEKTAAREALLGDLMTMIHERCPDAFPEEISAFVAAGDWEAIDGEFAGDKLVLTMGSGSTRMVDKNPRTLIIGSDFLLGRYSSFFSWGAFFIGWFTLWSLVTRGRSPGKALFRLRVIRLDGKPLRPWDCFSRAAGYGASAATLMLGFLEAIWHPNRQAIHDKIAGTVVIKG